MIFVVWFAALASGAAAWFGWTVGLAVFAALPLFAFVALRIADSHRLSWAEARRFMVLRTHRTRIAALRARQTALAAKLRALFAQRMPI